MVDAVFAPQPEDEVERLIEAFAGLADIDAEAGELPRLVAAPDTEIDPASRQHVELRDLLGHQNGVVQGQNDDAGPQPQLFRPRRQEGQQRRDVVAEAVLPEMMLGDPDAVKAHLLQVLDQLHVIVEHVAFAPARMLVEQVERRELHRRRFVGHEAHLIRQQLRRQLLGAVHPS